MDKDNTRALDKASSLYPEMATHWKIMICGGISCPGKTYRTVDIVEYYSLVSESP